MMDRYLMMIYRRSNIFILSFLLISQVGCKNDDNCYHNQQVSTPSQTYHTKNVIIVVADGLRYSESYGDPNCQYIPRMGGELAEQGVVNTKFYNLGDTYTSAGHTNLTTGFYQTIDNGGLEFPANPSIFQYWNQQTNSNKIKSWVIASKGKLAILGNSSDLSWLDKFTPSVNCGPDGLGVGSGYRDDSLTLLATTNILKANHPNLVLLNFMDPDLSAHSGDWNLYTKATRRTDEFIYQLWQFLQNDNIYKNTTAIFVTSDHGRHLDGVADGFVSHGDGCEGCRHLSFLAIGPDFKKGERLSVPREHIDIPVTIAHLLGFKLPNSRGNVMTELFESDRTR